MKDAAPGNGTASSRLNDPGRETSSLLPVRNQALPPLERHEPLPTDKLFWAPSPRRPRWRDLQRLVAHFATWDRP
jgi:hypothetical protein